MGYCSDYNGSYEPKNPLTKEQSDKILAWFVERFGPYEIDKGDGSIDWQNDDLTKCYCGSIYFDNVRSKNLVYPVCDNMKGYNFNYELYEFVQWLAKEMPDVEFTGSVERTGEEFGDCERISIVGHKVVSYVGQINYSNPEEVKQTVKEHNDEVMKQVRSYMGTKVL